MIPMLTGLKVLSLECKCAFWRPEHNTKGDPMELNLEGLEMQKWNINGYGSKVRWEKCHLSSY